MQTFEIAKNVKISQLNEVMHIVKSWKGIRSELSSTRSKHLLIVHSDESSVKTLIESRLKKRFIK